MSREGAREKPDEAAMGDRAVGTGGMRILLAAVAIADLPDLQCVLDSYIAQAAARWLGLTDCALLFAWANRQSRSISHMHYGIYT